MDGRRFLRWLALLFLLVVGVAGYLQRADLPEPQRAFQGATALHPFGFDHLGRDLFARTLSASYRGLLFALPGWLLMSVLGTTLGVLAAMTEHHVLGKVLGWLIQATYVTPFLLVLIGVVSLFGTGPLSLITIVLSVGWSIPARLARAVARDAIHAPYVLAARSVGYSQWSLATKLLVPICLPVVLTAGGPLIVEILAMEMTLTIFGFGPEPSTATLGGLLSDGFRFVLEVPRLLLLPLAAVALVCVSCRAAFDHGDL